MKIRPILASNFLSPLKINFEEPFHSKNWAKIKKILNQRGLKFLIKIESNPISPIACQKSSETSNKSS